MHRPTRMGWLLCLSVLAMPTAPCLAQDEPAALEEAQPLMPSDADQDGFVSVAQGGRDCADDNPAIHPGATEDPLGPGATQDTNCDGLPGAVITEGFFVSAEGDDGNTGTLAAPFKTIEQGVAAATLAIQYQPNVYLLADQEYVITKPLLVPQGVRLLGGYQKTEDGILQRSLDLDQPKNMTTIRLEETIRITGAPIGSIVGPTVLSGVRLAEQGNKARVTSAGHALTLHRTVLEQHQKDVAAALVFTGGADEPTLRLIESRVRHLGCTTEECIGLLVSTPSDQMTARLELDRSQVSVERATKSHNVAIWAYRDVDVQVHDSTIAAGTTTNTFQTVAMLLGYEWPSMEPMSIGAVDVERSSLQGGEVYLGKSAGLKVYRGEGVVVRNNLLKAGQKNGYGVMVEDTNTYLVNNTFTASRNGARVRFHQLTDPQITIQNNILDVTKTGLSIDSPVPLQALENNLFAPSVQMLLLSHIPGRQSLVVSISEDDPAATLNAARLTATAVGGAIVADPLLDAQGRLQSKSPAINAGINLIAERGVSAAGSDGIIDRDGEARPESGPWDIGADERE